MNRDTVIASVIGFGLGLVAAIALWIVPRILPKTAPSASPATQIIGTTDVIPSPDTEKIKLTSPTDGQILSTNTVEVAGQAKESTLIVVTTPAVSHIVKPDAEGRFLVPLDLKEGGNQINVTAYLGSEVATLPLTVFYQTEK